VAAIVLIGLVLSFLVGFIDRDTLRDSGVKLGQGRE
jgi:predicted neutral ceramidase superfamily lipid hydrolase